MSFLNFQTSESKSAKFYVQLLSAFNEPAAIFQKNGDLKLSSRHFYFGLSSSSSIKS